MRILIHKAGNLDKEYNMSGLSEASKAGLWSEIRKAVKKYGWKPRQPSQPQPTAQQCQIEENHED